MAMRNRQRDVPVPNGSVIVWMAGIVLGAGAGIVLVYHLLLASHAVASTTIRPMTAFAQVASAPTKTVIADEIRAEHAQALQDAMKPKG